MSKPLGVILAGGQARRMGGGDKGRLSIAGQSLFHRVHDRLLPHVSDLVLNANGPSERFDDLGLKVLKDGIDGFVGPLAGILAGLDFAAQTGAALIVTVAADTPFFPGDLVPRFLDATTEMERPLALAATEEEHGKQWLHPTFGLWPVALRNDLRTHITDGGRKIMGWVDQHPFWKVHFESGAYDPFFNINTVQDLDAAERIAETFA